MVFNELHKVSESFRNILPLLSEKPHLCFPVVADFIEVGHSKIPETVERIYRCCIAYPVSVLKCRSVNLALCCKKGNYFPISPEEIFFLFFHN